MRDNYRITQLTVRYLDLETSLTELSIWAFILALIAKFISKLFLSFNMGIIGVTLILNMIMAIYLIIIMINSITDHKNSIIVKDDLNKAFLDLLITFIAISVMIGFLLFNNFLISLGLIFLSFRSVLAFIITLFFIIQTIFIYINRSYNNSFNNEHKIKINDKKHWKIILERIKVSIILMTLMILAIILVNLLTIPKIDSLILDILSFFVLFIFLYYPTTILYLSSTEYYQLW